MKWIELPDGQIINMKNCVSITKTQVEGQEFSYGIAFELVTNRKPPPVFELVPSCKPLPCIFAKHEEHRDLFYEQSHFSHRHCYYPRGDSACGQARLGEKGHQLFHQR